MASPGDIRRARARAVGGKRDRCKRGKPCSAACVARWKTCLSEMPAPIQGAIPKAINAIQNRKERLGPKERRQAQQKRREFVKGRAAESAKLKEQRREFTKKRNSLTIQLKRAIIAGDAEKENDLRSRIKSADNVVGRRLKVPEAKPVDSGKVKEAFEEAGRSYFKRIMGLRKRMVEAAQPTERGARPNKQLYDKLESKLERLLNKDTSLGSNLSAMRDIKRNFSKGWEWGKAQGERRRKRESNFNSAYNSLMAEARKAAEDGDLKKYRRIEGRILKIIEKAGDRMGIATSNRVTKGELWKDTRLPKILANMRQAMDDALSEGNLEKFKNLETKFIRARDNFVSRGAWNSDRLYTAGGTKMQDGKGQAISKFIFSLKRDMQIAANSKDRRRYNSLEKTLLKLDPSAEAGKLWKKSVEGRVLDYAVSLRREMNKAIQAGDRRKYNKLERVLLRIDPEEKKGRMWRMAKIESYLPTLEEKLRKAAVDGNRKEYDKLERVLKRADPNNRPFDGEKGAVWNMERINVATSKLKEEMEAAVMSNNREKYDRLEAKFFKMRDSKLGDLIDDYDMVRASKGEIWNTIKNNKAIIDLKNTINEGKRDGVEKISIDGDAKGFSVNSRVLGNKLELSVTPNSSTSFRVNDSYTATDDLPKREVIAIIREVTRQYGEVMRRMEDDTVFRVSAAQGDGREDMRVKAYTTFGFSDPDYDGSMFGVVRNGKVEPSDEDEYYELRG